MHLIKNQEGRGRHHWAGHAEGGQYIAKSFLHFRCVVILGVLLPREGED